MILQPTRMNKTLTIVITDLHRLFQEPIIIPPVPVDHESSGVPSDHQGVLVLPINSSAPSQRTKKTITVRPIKDSALETFGQKFVLENWDFLDPDESPTSLVESFQLHCSCLVDEHFPLKTVKLSSYDTPFFTERLRLLRRQRQREYRRSGRSEKYLDIKKLFDEAFLKAAHNYKDKIIAEVTEGKRGSSYKALKKLGNSSAEEENFQIPSHVDSNLTPQQSAEVLADYFSVISQEFDPIDRSKFSPALKQKLLLPSDGIPTLEEYEIHKKIVSSKKPNSSVPGDLPKKVVNTFSVELARPMEIIFNAITTKAEYPRQWIKEYQTPIPKVHPPSSEDDLRNLSCTPFF